MLYYKFPDLFSDGITLSDMIENILLKIGLKEREIKIYLSLLKNGAQPASSMARQLGIPRTSAQFSAEKLCDKSFARKFIKNKITYYLADSLQMIKQVLDFNLENYQLAINNQKEYLNKFEKEINTQNVRLNQKSKVIFYEGLDNVIKSYWELIQDMQEGDFIYNYVYPATEKYPEFRNGMRRFIKERVSRKIKVKLICADCEDAIRLKTTDRFSLRETRINSRKKLDPFFSEIAITKNKILSISSSHGLFSNIIYDKNIAQMQMAIFEMAWQQAERDDKQIMNLPKTKQLIDKFRNISEY